MNSMNYISSDLNVCNLKVVCGKNVYFRLMEKMGIPTF